MFNMSSKVQISKLKSHLGFWLRFVSNYVSYAFARKLAKHSITVAEWVILREIFEYNRSVSQNELVQSTGLTKGAISKLIARLIEKKLLSCKQDLDDRRYQTMELTEKAILLIPKLAGLADKNDCDFFACLNTNERNKLMLILQKIVKENKLTNLPIK